MGKGERLTAVLTGGPPWGFRLSGGLEVKQPLKVAKVRKKSKAHGSGLQEGDEVLAVNGAPCQDVTHKDCMGIVEGATDRLELEVLRKRPTYNAQPAGQTTEQEESGSKLEIKVNSVAKKDNKQHVSTLQIKPVTVSASSVKSESRREVSAITVAKEESSSQHSQVVRSTESEYSTLERKSKNVSKVNGLGQVSVFSGSVRSEEEKSEERKTQGFSYLQPGDIRSLGQSGSPEEKQRRAPPPTAARPSQEEFPVNPPPSYSRALVEPQYQQVYSPTSGQPGDQPFEEEEPPSSAFRSVRPPGPIKLESQQGHGINSHPGPLPRQQQQIQEPQAVTSTQPAVQRPTPIRQQPATVYQPERQAGSPHTWSAGVPKQGPVPAPQPAAQQPAGSYPFDPPAPYSQPPVSAPTHTWNPAGRAKPKTPITPTTPTEASPNKVFSVFDVGATWEPPKEEDERAAENMMNAKPKAPMFKVKKFDFKPQTWSEGSSSGRPMTQEDFQTMDLPLGPMGQYRDKQREMLAYEKSGAVWSPSGTTPVSGPKAWSPGGGEVQGRPHEVREVREQPWSPTGRPQAPQPQSPQPAPAVWSPGGGGGQAPRAAQPVSFLPGGGGGDHGPQPTSNGVWRPSQMPPSSQGYYSGERDSGIWSPTGTTQATAPSRSFNDTDGHASPASFDPRPKMVSAQSSSARSAAASLKKPAPRGRYICKRPGLPSYRTSAFTYLTTPRWRHILVKPRDEFVNRGDITPVPTGDIQPGSALVATGPVMMNGTVHVNLEWQNQPESYGYGVRTPATITLEEPLKVSDEEDLYPPEERYKVKICHRLARALLSRRNRFSRGGRMFWKRRLKAHKWEADPFGPAVHPRDATPQEFRPGVDVPDVPEDLYQLVLEEIREGPADDDVDETDSDYPYNSPGAPGRGGKAVGPTRVGPLPSYLNIQEEQTRNASEHFMTVKPTPALTSQEPSKPTLQALPTRSYIEIQKEPKPEPENAADKEKKQKQRLHPKSISEYYNLPPEAALPEKDTTKRIPVSEIEPINFNVDLEDRSRCTHQTPEMLSHDAARRLAEATFFEEGKGANMFMKRMERMSKYVIDESNVKKAPPKPQVSPNAQQYQYQQQQQQKSTPTVQEMKDMMSQVTYKRPPKSPWEAAMEGSGKIEGAFSHIRGNKLLLDVPAGSQQEYDPFDPTLPFPGAQPTDLGGEGGPGWAAQDGMIEKPTSPTGPQFKDFNPKPRGWVSSGGGYLSDQLAADYESDTNMSTSSAPARQLFKVSKVTGKEPSVWLPGQ
ncbi:uncharacterized protein [Branchiostoma lanceolatum]|uniref:uncharacterized protein n=1 Tax=Branchiostoma lanceolatum TaxID=7740 RepID=UPI0034539345